MPLGVIAEQACRRPSRAVPVRAAGSHRQISVLGARVVPSRWWWTGGGGEGGASTVPSGAGVLPSAPSWLSLYRLPALPLHPHPLPPARIHIHITLHSLSPSSPPFLLAPCRAPTRPTAAVCSAVCWLRVRPRPLRCATSAADSPDTPRLRAIQASYSSPVPKNPSASAPIIGLSPISHSKYPQLPAQPSLHAHSLTTRLPSSARQQSHSPSQARELGPYQAQRVPSRNIALLRFPLLRSPNTPVASSRTAASPLTAAARRPAALFESTTLVGLAVRRANRPPVRVRLRLPACAR
jgi:hypothetical protein